MKSEKLLNAIGQINDEYITEIEPRAKKDKKIFWKLGAVAACLILALGIGIPLLISNNNKIDLSLSSGNIRVEYIGNIGKVPSSRANWIELTEEELFSKHETVIFQGTIKEIRNIKINYNGEKEYNAIAKITVEKVYRGDINEGDTHTVFLPCPIDKKGYWVSGNETVSAMREGMRGIFMPIQYDEDSYREQKGATLFLTDIASLGFIDGWRFAFLETDKGLVFSKEAFKSISSAATLEEVENYIVDMISK